MAGYWRVSGWYLDSFWLGSGGENGNGWFLAGKVAVAATVAGEWLGKADKLERGCPKNSHSQASAQKIKFMLVLIAKTPPLTEV